MDTTTEEIVMSLGLPKKSAENLKNNNVQQKEKIAPNSSTAPKPTQTPQKGNSKAPAQKSARPTTTQKSTATSQPLDIQKNLETVSSVVIKTGEDVPKIKEKMSPSKPERRVNNYSVSGKTPQKEEGNLSARSRPEKPDIKPVVNKKVSPQARPSTTQAKTPVTNPVEKANTKTQLETRNEHKVSPKVIGKTLSPVKNEPKPVITVTQPTPKNSAPAPIERKTSNVVNQDKKAVASKPKVERQTLPVRKEPLKKGSVPTISQEKLQPSSSRKSAVMRYPEECIVGDLEAIRMISPVSHDTKDSKGMCGFSTPGYNFDSPQHNNPNNLSINDSKNLSFESSLFGKDSIGKMDSLQTRRKSGFGVDQNKPKETMKRNNSVKQEKVSTEEDLESNFTKAFTARKNRVVNDLPDFDSRLDSDLYYRRRFRVE